MNSLVVLMAVVSVTVAAPSLGHAVAYSVPAAVSHQSRVDVHSSPAVVATSVYEPVVEARAVVPAATVYAAPAAVSHQSRVDVRSSPAVVASAPIVAAAPVFSSVVEPAVVESRSVYSAPVATVYSGGSAVSHQSRVDVETSPALVAQQFVAPAVVNTRNIWSPSVYSAFW